MFRASSDEVEPKIVILNGVKDLKQGTVFQWVQVLRFAQDDMVNLIVKRSKSEF